MKRLLLTSLGMLTCLLAACAGPSGTGPGNLASGIRYYNSNLGIGDYLVEVAPGGDLTVTERVGPGEQNMRRVTGHLSAEQMSSLRAALQGWGQLKASYPGEWSVLVQIVYDGHTVDVHDLSQAPASFIRVLALLTNDARAAVGDSTRPAPATSPTTLARPPASRP